MIQSKPQQSNDPPVSKHFDDSASKCSHLNGQIFSFTSEKLVNIIHEILSSILGGWYVNAFTLTLGNQDIFV